MADLVGSGTFEGWTVHLVDLNAEAAEVMARVGRRMAEDRGADLTFVPHTDRREALPGARFVTTTIAVGAAEGWRLDLEVPGRYGIAQTVGDSVGPGGCCVPCGTCPSWWRSPATSPTSRPAPSW